MLESGLINFVSPKTEVVNTHNQIINSNIAKIFSGIRGRGWPARLISLKKYNPRLNAAATARATARICSAVIARINHLQ